MTKQLTYDQTEKTNRIKDKKIKIIEKIADFFLILFFFKTDAIFLVVLMRYFSKKKKRGMRLPSLVKNKLHQKSKILHLEAKTCLQ